MRKRMACWLLMLLAVTSFTNVVSARAAAGDEKAVQAAADKFYSALNAMFTGDIEPMKAVWSHADDVTYMGPGGGLLSGWADVAAIWEKQAALKLGGQVVPQDMKMIMGQDFAVTSNYELGENTDKDGKVQKVSIRATNVFRKENGEWKMVSHHTDLLPYLQAEV